MDFDRNDFAGDLPQPVMSPNQSSPGSWFSFLAKSPVCFMYQRFK
jgi:hypothetical protein